MRLDPDGTITLSRRNLLALLHKLDREDSARTLIGGRDAPGVVVRSEPDEEHYGSRDHPPGSLHPTEEARQGGVVASSPLPSDPDEEY